MKNHQAIFLDRDGTINEEVGYLDSMDKLRMLPNAARAVRLINAAKMKAVVITNQAGVAKGLFTEDMVHKVHAQIQILLKEEGALIDRFYYCPHHPTEGQGTYLVACSCRKPAAGMLLAAATDLNIDLKRSYMIGDTAKDIEAAASVGVKGILVRTGYGQDQQNMNVSPAYIADDIFDAVQWIIREIRL